VRARLDTGLCRCPPVVVDFTGGAGEDFSVTSFCDKGRNRGREKTLLDHQFGRFVFPRSFLQCAAFFDLVFSFCLSIEQSILWCSLFVCSTALHVIALPRGGEMMTESIFGLENRNLPSIFSFLCFRSPSSSSTAFCSVLAFRISLFRERKQDPKAWYACIAYLDNSRRSGCCAELCVASISLDFRPLRNAAFRVFDLFSLLLF
jgi:hypothetical protein